MRNSFKVGEYYLFITDSFYVAGRVDRITDTHVVVADFVDAYDFFGLNVSDRIKLDSDRMPHIKSNGKILPVFVELSSIKKVCSFKELVGIDVKSDNSPFFGTTYDEYSLGGTYTVITWIMRYVGKLVEATPTEIVLDRCFWIADVRQWSTWLRTGRGADLEQSGDGMIISRSHITDVFPGPQEWSMSLSD